MAAPESAGAPAAIAAAATVAAAKVNLTLRILGRRADNYHDIDSLVVFAGLGDRLVLKPGATLELRVDGPTAQGAGPVADNLVLKAAGALAARAGSLRAGCFLLTKQLPVAAGLGGGSADAAAALRLLARANDIPADDPRLLDAARTTGADVPVCLDPRPRVMGGIGDLLSQPLVLPALAALLVNPGVAVPTKDVFARLDRAAGGQRSERPCLDPASIPRDRDGLIDFLAQHGNDLEPPARMLQPVISDVIAALRATSGCRLARMSGSGATCFALYGSDEVAGEAGRRLRAAHPDWWIEPTTLG
jgi:4-diphosphocytidyl-2-C-methyl-D-erythritol kinase